MTANATNWVETIGAPAYASIAEMVAALNVDYDRLEELRDERDGYDALTLLQDARENFSMDEGANAAPDGPGYANDREAWAGENPEDAADLARLESLGTTDAAVWAAEYPDDAEELKELESAAGECADQDAARERIEEDAISVQVRSGWVTPGADMTAEEFEILLTTGGPAVRIRGELDGSGEPYRAWLEVQDWGKPWTQYHPADGDTLLTYASVFCFAS